MSWRRPFALVLLSLLQAVASHAETLAEAPWLRLELRDDASPLDALRLSPERERQAHAANADYNEMLVRYESESRTDGTQAETVSLVRRYLSDEGIEEGGNLEFSVMPSRMDAVIERAYVLRPDGSRIPIDTQAIQIMPDETPRVFSDVRRVVVPFPGLTRDATAVFVYRTVFRAKDWPFPNVSSFMLRGFHPIERFELAFSWDPSLAAPHWSTTDPELDCQAKQHGLLCVRNQIPAASIDPDLRSYYDESPDLSVGEAISWTQVAASARGVVEAKISEGLPPGALEKILAGATTPEQRWQAIFNFVANEIRYLGLEHGSGAVVPRAPAVTLGRRYGDCKDKVSLLLALARAAGIDAYAVLVSTERFDLSRLQIPATSYFNHMIACRNRDDGSRECVDPTMSSVAAENSVASLGGAVLLELRETTQAPGQLERRRFSSEFEIEQETRIDCDGSRHSKVTRRLRGQTANEYRQALMTMSPQERTRALGDEYRQLVSKTTRPSFEIQGLKTPDAPLAISIQASTPPSSPFAQDPAVFDSDVWTIFHGIALRSDNQHFSYLNPGSKIHSRLSYQACEGLQPRFMGAQLALESRFGRLERNYTTEASKVIVNSTFEVPSGRIAASEIAEFNRFLETALDQADVWFQLGEK